MGHAQTKAKSKEAHSSNATATNSSGGACKNKRRVVKELQRESNFDMVEVNQLYDIFNEMSENDTKPVDRETFAKGLARLSELRLLREGSSVTEYSDRLFELLDLDHNGQLDLKEFVGGLSLLCKGTVEEKLELSFALYDRDGNGAIDRRELALMFEHAWLAGVKALRAEHASADDDEMRELSDEELAQFAKKMASVFAEQAFAALDIDDNGSLDVDEFKSFALSEPKITATLGQFQKQVNVAFW